MPRLHRGLAATVVCALGASALFASPIAATAAEPGIRINEVESSQGQPGDWIEFYNPTNTAIVLDGYTVKDSGDKDAYVIVAGTTVEPGAYLVLDEKQKTTADGAFVFGLGAADSVRLFDTTGALVDERTWAAHAATTWGIADDGSWALTGGATKGAANTFAAVEPEPTPTPTPTPTPNPTPTAPAGPGEIVINEIDSAPSDWIEFYNPGSAALDISGYEIRDNSEDHRWQFLPGTSIAAGAFLVVTAQTIGRSNGAEVAFESPIGIGSADRIRIYDTSGAMIDDSLPWQGHASLNGSEAAATLARCPDGVGSFLLAYPTAGASNDCVVPVRINEVESDGTSPDDWIELVNPTDAALDVSGIVVKDDDDGHAYTIPANTRIAAGGYLVIERDALGFGLGGGDAVRLFDGDRVIDETTWGAGHAATTWGRCPDGDGPFEVTAEATKGAVNLCEDDIAVAEWPGAATVTVLDREPTFLEDSSGLDAQATADGTFLWAVDNGTGIFWKLRVAADGSTTFAEGWTKDGKRAQFIKDAGKRDAKGPDTEGITAAGDGFVYLASERDNGDNAVNQNVVLKVDPNAPGPDVVATQQWDLTALLPQVEANLGIEAVEWIADAELTDSLIDDTTGALYDPAAYPGHGDGLFFVAVEDTGDVYAFALGADGTAKLVATIDPGLAGVMALDYDIVLGVLWAVCDNGCGGESAQITLNGTAEPGIAHVARPAGMPDVNNEGFATAPAASSATGERAAWWFEDGFPSRALRLGTLPTAITPAEPGTENPPLPGTPGTEIPALPGTGPSVPLPGTSLTSENRGTLLTPATAERGERITATVGAQHAGESVTVWLYSSPAQIGAGVLDASGRIVVTVPADATLGDHRLAVYAADGEMLGWTGLRIVDSALAATGGESAVRAFAIGLLLLLAGGVAVAARRRIRTA
jgi:hypothetical protein